MSAEELRSMRDDELGAALARAIEWPATPDLPSIVSAAIEETERAPAPIRPRLSLPSRRRTLLVLVAAFLALAAAAVAAKLVFDIGAIQIQTVPTGILPSPVLTGSALGYATTLEGAAQEAFPPLVPARLGPPDRVWVEKFGGDTRVVLAWLPTKALPAIGDVPYGATLTELRGEAVVYAKSYFSDESGMYIQPTRVGGEPAYWLTGPHELDVVTDEGGVARYRVTGNVLIWQRGGLTLRLETSLDLVSARAIANSV